MQATMHTGETEKMCLIATGSLPAWQLATQSWKAHNCWAHGKQSHWIKKDDSCVHIWFHTICCTIIILPNIWWSLHYFQSLKCNCDHVSDLNSVFFSLEIAFVTSLEIQCALFVSISGFYFCYEAIYTNWTSKNNMDVLVIALLSFDFEAITL